MAGKNYDSNNRIRVVSNFEITIEKFADGTYRPMVTNNGMSFVEVIGMLELIKMELAEKSWAKAAQIRGESGV